MLKYFDYSINNYNFTIVQDNNYIVMISLTKEVVNAKLEETELIKKTKLELEEYFKGKRKSFDIPLKLTGTDYQNQVWKIMQQIPYGSTLSYGELAKKIGNPKSSRAVGSACHNNKILILIPCHRVTAKNSLGGFGCGIDMKVNLLELEKKNCNF